MESEGSLQIIIDNSGYHLRNLGDVAMLEGAVRRLIQLRINPALSLSVITSDSKRLNEFIPEVTALDDRIPQVMESERLFPIPHRLIPKILKDRLSHREQEMRVTKSLQLLNKRRIKNREWMDMVKNCDAVIATGGGYLTDSFKDHAMRLLGHLSLAQSLKRPTAFFGQGIGPIENQQLLRSAIHVLKRTQSIGLREPLIGKSILEKHGINSGVFTGDDALEIIDFEARKGDPHLIGVNVRRSHYAGLTTQGWEVMKRGIAEVAELFEEPLCPIPIDFVSKENDETSAMELIPTGHLKADYVQPKKPSEVIELVSKCCFLITGSYHAALFGLAQGVPVIGIEASDYYKGKFDGLEAIYEGGVVRYNPNKDSIEQLIVLSRKMKKVPSEKRKEWIEKSMHLKEQGRQFYRCFFERLG